MPLNAKQRQDLLKALNLNPNATPADIKKAYHKLALEHHPDKHSTASDAEKKFHEAAFKKAQAAYDGLTKDTATVDAPANTQQASADPSGPSAQPSPSPSRSGPSWKNKHREEVDAFERQLFNQIQQQNEALEKLGAEIKIKKLLEEAPTPKPAPKDALAIEENPKNKGALIPVGDDGQLALRNNFVKGSQYQIDYTDQYGNKGSAVYDNRGDQPQITVDLSNHASIEAGVKAAQAAGWRAVGVYDSVPQEKQDEIKKCCEEHGLEFFVVPRPQPTAAIEDKKELDPAKSDGDAAKSVTGEAVPQLAEKAYEPPTPFDGMKDGPKAEPE